jgi:hypothetical protein
VIIRSNVSPGIAGADCMTVSKKPPKAPTLPEVKSDNVVKEEQAKGEVRPDGPGDESAPVEPEPRDNAR